MPRMKTADGSYIHMPTMIEYPDAYEKAKKARIIANANKTFWNTYEDAAEIEGFLSAGRICDEEGNFKCYTDNFVGSLACAYHSFGKLSEKQVQSVRKAIADRNARKAEWASKQALIDAKKQHIGAIGEKITLTLTCVHIVELNGVYGTNFIHICEDADKNTIIYKGNSFNFPSKGETATIKAVVKEHGVRNGIKQTVIQRPKVV